MGELCVHYMWANAIHGKRQPIVRFMHVLLGCTFVKGHYKNLARALTMYGITRTAA